MWQAKEYVPLLAGSIDGTDTKPHDHGIVRAIKAKYKPDIKVQGDPECTVFVARLNYDTTEDSLQEFFGKFGSIRNLRLIRDIVTGFSKGHAFVEFTDRHSARDAQSRANRCQLDGREIFVDFEIERTMPGWVPRRLGGGFGGKKESGQLRFGGRDRPFRPTQQVRLGGPRGGMAGEQRGYARAGMEIHGERARNRRDSRDEIAQRDRRESGYDRDRRDSWADSRDDSKQREVRDSRDSKEENFRDRRDSKEEYFRDRRNSRDNHDGGRSDRGNIDRLDTQSSTDRRDRRDSDRNQLDIRDSNSKVQKGIRDSSPNVHAKNEHVEREGRRESEAGRGRDRKREGERVVEKNRDERRREYDGHGEGKRERTENRRESEARKRGKEMREGE
eukprot:comp20164_c0_seq1/m.24965 comp20164_c0_seq1/g.24965  ORF comp20164_c0_seq1/g.24965 comp20164_c0_seq1/m.24965 type:complete len:389 (-) comp20164_c0_seq1:67-1233(-)